MRRRWLAGIFAVSAIWAILVAVISSDHVHQLWGEMAAIGYGLALMVALAVRNARGADIAEPALSPCALATCWDRPALSCRYSAASWPRAVR